MLSILLQLIWAIDYATGHTDDRFLYHWYRPDVFVSLIQAIDFCIIDTGQRCLYHWYRLYISVSLILARYLYHWYRPEVFVSLIQARGVCITDTDQRFLYQWYRPKVSTIQAIPNEHVCAEFCPCIIILLLIITWVPFWTKTNCQLHFYILVMNFVPVLAVTFQKMWGGSKEIHAGGGGGGDFKKLNFGFLGIFKKKFPTTTPF